MKSVVAVVPCSSYENEQVYTCVKQGLSLLGGISKFVSQSESVLVKPNLLSGASPEKAITTHPSVFEAMLRLLREEGYDNLQYGDSSGSPIGSMESVVKQCGLDSVAEKYNVPFGNFEESVTVEYPEGKTAKKFVLAKAIEENEALISLCKMKTHALENITGAVKNQYGCIYGTNKAIGHAKYPNSRIFADMLSDLNTYVHPRLYVMDGIMAMEGNGPASGTPTPMNVLLFSSDPVALDAVFAKLVYLNPQCVPTCVSGQKHGVGTMEYENITILIPEGEISADELAKQYGNSKFDVKRSLAKFWRFRIFSSSKKQKDRPVVDLSKCIGCGVCEEACPVEGKAVHSGNGEKARYEYDKCIRCYCCQEMCPAKAISRKG